MISDSTLAFVSLMISDCSFRFTFFIDLSYSFTFVSNNIFQSLELCYQPPGTVKPFCCHFFSFWLFWFHALNNVCHWRQKTKTFQWKTTLFFSTLWSKFLSVHFFYIKIEYFLLQTFSRTKDLISKRKFLFKMVFLLTIQVNKVDKI